MFSVTISEASQDNRHVPDLGILACVVIHMMSFDVTQGSSHVDPISVSHTH